MTMSTEIKQFNSVEHTIEIINNLFFVYTQHVHNSLYFLIILSVLWNIFRPTTTTDVSNRKCVNKLFKKVIYVYIFLLYSKMRKKSIFVIIAFHNKLILKIYILVSLSKNIYIFKIIWQNWRQMRYLCSFCSRIANKRFQFEKKIYDLWDLIYGKHIRRQFIN